MARRNSQRRGGDAKTLRQHQRVLIDLAQFGADSVDLQSFVGGAVGRISTALEIEHVKLLRYRREHADLFMEAGVGWRPGVVGAAAFATDLTSPVGRAYQTGQPVVIDDVSQADGFRLSEVLRSHGIVSLSNVPILTSGAVWGVVECDSTRRRAFGADSQWFMVMAAALVSLVIRRFDTQARQDAANAAVAREMQKRELLLEEMQHRVKNNFQTIIALIAMRTPGHGARASQDLATTISDAIMAMSLAHDQLSPTRTGEVVALAAYLRALVASFVIADEAIAIEVTADEVSVSIEQAVPIGLIVNELVTNAVRHAFGAQGGSVGVELHAAARPGSATLVVSDDGKGIDEAAEEHSGRRLVRALADQILGELTQESSRKGTRTTLSFLPRTPAELRSGGWTHALKA